MQNDFRRDLIRSSLRMRPDRLSSEKFGGAEICEPLTAYNSARREYVDRARNTARHAALDGDHAPDGNGHSIVCHTKTDRIGN